MSNWPLWLWWTGAGTIAAAGALLLAWAFFWDRARGRKRCPKCWYDMAGIAPAANSTWTCPECGVVIPRERRLRRTRRRWRWSLAGLILIALGAGAPIREQVRRDGWLSFVPTRVLLWATFSDRFKTNKDILDELTYHRFGRNAIASWQRDSIVSALLSRLEAESDSRKRWSIVVMLANIGGQDKRVTPALLSAIPQSDAHVRVQIVRSFGIYKADPDQVIQPLIGLFADPTQDVGVRSEAAGVLAEYGSRASAAIETFKSVLNDRGELGDAAIWGIGRVAPNSFQVVPLLLDRLQDPPDINDRRAFERWNTIIQAIGYFPDAASDTVPVLLNQLNLTSDPGCRVELLRAIARLETAAAPAAKSLQRIAADPEEAAECSVLATASLDVIAGRQPSIAAALTAALRDTANPAAPEASRSLWSMRLDVRPVLPALLDEVNEGVNADVMMKVVSILSNVHDPSGQTLECLRELERRFPGGNAGYAIHQLERREWKGP